MKLILKSQVRGFTRIRQGHAEYVKPHIRTLAERMREEKSAQNKADKIAAKPKLNEKDVRYLMDHYDQNIRSIAQKLATRYGRPDMGEDTYQDMRLAYYNSYLSNQNKGSSVTWHDHLMRRAFDFGKRQIQKYSKILQYGDAERDSRRYAAIKAFSDAYEQRHGQKPDMDTIAEAIRSTPNRVQEIMLLSKVTESLSRETNEGSADRNIALSETIASDAETPDDAYERKNFREVFEERMYKLPEMYHPYIQAFIDHVTEGAGLKELSEMYQKPLSTLGRYFQQMKEWLRGDEVLQEFKSRMFETLSIAKSLSANMEIFGLDRKTLKLYRFVFSSQTD